MSQFNLNAVGDKRELTENDAKHAARAAKIVQEGQANINAQLIKDFIETQGLDINKDRDEIIALCEEIGVEPNRVGIEIEEQTSEITRNNDEMPQLEDDGRNEK